MSEKIFPGNTNHDSGLSVGCLTNSSHAHSASYKFDSGDTYRLGLHKFKHVWIKSIGYVFLPKSVVWCGGNFVHSFRFYLQIYFGTVTRL